MHSGRNESATRQLVTLFRFGFPSGPQRAIPDFYGVFFFFIFAYFTTRHSTGTNPPPPTTTNSTRYISFPGTHLLGRRWGMGAFVFVHAFTSSAPLYIYHRVWKLFGGRGGWGLRNLKVTECPRDFRTHKSKDYNRTPPPSPMTFMEGDGTFIIPQYPVKK